MGKIVTEEIKGDDGDIIGGGGEPLPTGIIIAWMGGIFTGANNTGNLTTTLSDNTISAANTYLASYGYKVCDGTIISDGDSPFNGDYVPDLTDNRFVMGDTSVGGGTAASALGGSNNSLAHTHSFTQPSGHSAHGITRANAHSFTQPTTHGITQATCATQNHQHQSAHQSGTTVYSYNISGSNIIWYQANGLWYSAFDEVTIASVPSRTLTYYTITDGVVAHSLGTSAALSNNHAGGSVNAHAGGSYSAHSAHVNGAASTVIEGRTDENLPEFMECFYIMKIV